MAWKRRQPTWPYVVAVGCLFALTLAAPAWWRRHHAPSPAPRGSSTLPHRAVGTSGPWQFATPDSRQASTPPTLPPLVGGEPRPQLDDPTPEPAPLAAPSLTTAVVESNDYVVIDEPLVDESVANTSPAWDATMPSFDAPAPFAPAPTASSLPTISPAVLARAREALLAMVTQAREYESPTRAAGGMRVVVESSNDRLAMIPDLADPAPTLAEPLALEPLAQETSVRTSVGPALRHRPISLLREIEALQSRPVAAPWATRVMAGLDQLTNLPAAEPAALAALLAELKDLASAGFNDALTATNPADHSAWIRSARALDRRLPIWQTLLEAPAASDAAARPADAGAESLLQSLHQVAGLTAGTTEGEAWRTYLRLDDLAGLTSVGADEFADARRAAARDVLIRMADPRLTPQQAAFLTQPPLAALAIELRPWAAGDVSVDALAALVESYEMAPTQADAEAIAELRLRMKWSGDPRLEALADQLNRNYRNANLRFAMSAELFDRLIPPQEPIVARLNDKIAGTEIRGRSRTETDVHVRLTPDPTAWRFDLDVEGTVQSRTYSDVGPARVHNASRMEYELHKTILLSRQGLQISAAEASVNGRNTLVGVESAVDRVPLVGHLVESVVQKKHRDNQGAAMAQVKAKVRRQAQERMDREADAKLNAMRDRFAAEIWAPLARFSLAAEPVDMSTTEERAVMRLRLAGEQHLGAHTPRPSAPSDSLASLQLHESAINNAVRGLDLDGRRMTVGELHELLRAKFTARPQSPPTDLPQRAIVEFAKHDAVCVKCSGDGVELTLNIVELRKGRDSIRNVGVHAFFRPVVDGLEMKLVRDGTLQFEGAHLRTGPRLVLHSVFGKLLRKDQEIPVLAARLGDDPRLAGLMVTQLVIDDGWVALSIGPVTPARTAWRTRVPLAR